MANVVRRYVATGLATVFTVLPCQALANAETWQLSASAVLIHQTADTSAAASETSASADVLISHVVNNAAGQWLLHVEGSTSTDPDKISSVYPEANADAGSALDAAENGRLQVSELYYSHAFSDLQSLSLGMLDVSGFFEQSRIASDETTQFLGASFTGNPTIAFPDYTLGLVYQHELPGALVVRAAVASSNGLADNPGRSYANLFTISEDNKGIFSIGSLSWQAQGWLFRLGAWVNTADHLSLTGQDPSENNYGYYLLTGYKYGRHAVNMRLGYANPQVSMGTTFSSISYLYQLGQYSAGVGAARSFVSDHAPQASAKDTTHYEAFLRYNVSAAWIITADIQHIQNSNFTSATDEPQRDVSLAGLRLTWLYN